MNIRESLSNRNTNIGTQFCYLCSGKKINTIIKKLNAKRTAKMLGKMRGRMVGRSFFKYIKKYPAEHDKPLFM